MAKLVSAEIALGALLESLVNPTLAKMHSFGPFGAPAAELEIANQMEAVAWLYNQYICQELPDLVALDWEDLCNKASNLQTRLSKFFGVRYGQFSGGGYDLTPSEQKVKNACEAAKALRAANNFRKNTFVTKVCVCLLNFGRDKCVLALGATTVGVWSFIEKEKHGQGNENGSFGRLKFRLADDEFAFKAVQEQTGINANVLQIEDRFLINDDLNRAGGDTKFFIMSCMGTFDLYPTSKSKNIACWISLDIVFSKASDQLIDSSGSSVHCTPAVQYFRLRPFCSSVESWLTRQQLTKSLAPITSAAEENLENQNKLLAPMVEEKSDEDKQRLSEPEVNGVALNMELSAPTGSPQSSIGRESNQKHAAGSEHKECARAEACMTNAGGIIDVEESHFGHQTEVDDKERQSKLELNTVGLNTKFPSALKCRTEVWASRDGVITVELPASAKEREECKARRIDGNTNVVASNLNVTAPNHGLHSSKKTYRKREDRVFNKGGAPLSIKRACRKNRKKREALYKELLKANTVGSSTNFAFAFQRRTEVLASRDRVTMKELCESAMEWEHCRARQIDRINNAVASDMNVTAHDCGPHSSKKIDKKEEERILSKAGALLSFKASHRSVMRKRNDLCKELRDHMTRAYILYKQIAEGDSHLATLMPGNKEELQLAIQLCKTDEQKQKPSSNVMTDQLQLNDALLKSSEAELQLAVQPCKTDGQKQTPSSDVIADQLQSIDTLLKSSEAELQLAVQPCKTDGQKQTPSSDIITDQLQSNDALLKSSEAELQLAIQPYKTDGQKQTPSSDVIADQLQSNDALLKSSKVELQLAVQPCKIDGQKQTPSSDAITDQLQSNDALLRSSKAELQLAVQLCKTDGQKQTPSSDVYMDQLQPDDSLLKPSRAMETSYEKRPFQMLKSSMQELKEVCTRNEWPLPSYGVFSFKSKGGQCLYNGKVKIRGSDFELSESGEASETAKAAKLSAAAYMLSTLQHLKAKNAMLWE